LGELQEVFWTYLWAKYHNSCMYLMAKLWNIWHFIPFSACFGFIFDLFSCLTDKFIAGLCLYAGDAYLLWMNFNFVFCWILLIILCIFVITCLWLSSCLAHECIPCWSPNLQPRNISETLNLVYFIEFYLRLCWLVSLALETISGTNSMKWTFQGHCIL